MIYDFHSVKGFNARWRKFEAEIINPEKEFVILIYAQWCGYCKEVMPIWKELTSSEVAIVSIEDTVVKHIVENMKSEFASFLAKNVKGYPTIIKVEKNKIIFFDGDRTKIALQKFIGKLDVNKIFKKYS